MKRLITIVGLSLALFAPMAADAATVRIIHGISGTALGLDADLPVDIWVNGNPFLTDVPFLANTDPVELPAGSYDIEIYLAGSLPKDTAPVLEKTIFLGANDDAHIIAHFKAWKGIDLSFFRNNDRRVVASPISEFIAPRDLRLTVRHTAQFPRAALHGLLMGADPNLENGDSLSLDLNSGSYGFWLAYAGSRATLSSEPTAEVMLDPGAHYYVYAVGSPADGSFQLLVFADQVTVN